MMTESITNQTIKTDIMNFTVQQIWINDIHQFYDPVKIIITIILKLSS